jgi:hypothetical protein
MTITSTSLSVKKDAENAQPKFTAATLMRTFGTLSVAFVAELRRLSARLNAVDRRASTTARTTKRETSDTAG